MGKRKRSSYSEEFKVEAVNLAKLIGNTKAALDLGVNEANIRRWRDEFSSVSVGKSKDNNLEEKVRRLKKENHYLKKINEVLKKSTAILSQDQFPDFY